MFDLCPGDSRKMKNKLSYAVDAIVQFDMGNHALCKSLQKTIFKLVCNWGGGGQLFG